jgi:hypothetical protein
MWSTNEKLGDQGCHAEWYELRVAMSMGIVDRADILLGNLMAQGWGLYPFPPGTA